MERDLRRSEQFVIRWYEAKNITLPWRSEGTQECDPYFVWVSEVMLHQTTVQTVKGYYERFLERFPSLQSLADAQEEDVLALWQGLGYYRRAVLLHACAKELVYRYAGVWPRRFSELMKLPGVGAYTAGAIMVFAYNENAPAVDTNVGRVLCRLLGIQYSRGTLQQLSDVLQKNLFKTPRYFYGGVMDIGRTLCQARRVSCDLCPLQSSCTFFHEHKGVLPADSVPTKSIVKSELYTCFFVFLRGSGEVWLRRGSGHGNVLSRLWMPPSTPWMSYDQYRSYVDMWPNEFSLVNEEPVVHHIFSHIHLRAHVIVRLDVSCENFGRGKWANAKALAPASVLCTKVLGQAGLDVSASTGRAAFRQ